MEMCKGRTEKQRKTRRRKEAWVLMSDHVTSRMYQIKKISVVLVKVNFVSLGGKTENIFLKFLYQLKTGSCGKQ